jgi:hypothetical protein
LKGEVDDSKEKGKEETAQNAAPQEKRGVQKAALVFAHGDRDCVRSRGHKDRWAA